MISMGNCRKHEDAETGKKVRDLVFKVSFFMLSFAHVQANTYTRDCKKKLVAKP